MLRPCDRRMNRALRVWIHHQPSEPQPSEARLMLRALLEGWPGLLLLLFFMLWLFIPAGGGR